MFSNPLVYIAARQVAAKWKTSAIGLKCCLIIVLAFGLVASRGLLIYSKEFA